jgi:hypothetical protein
MRKQDVEHEIIIKVVQTDQIYPLRRECWTPFNLLWKSVSNYIDQKDIYTPPWPYKLFLIT